MCHKNQTKPDQTKLPLEFHFSWYSLFFQNYELSFRLEIRVAKQNQI